MGLNVITYALSKKYAKEYTDAVVAALPKAVVYRGVVNFYTDLPAVATVGDAYSVKFKYTYRLESRIAAPVAWPTDYFTRTGEGTEINPYVYEAVPVDTEYVTDTFYLRRQETDGNEFVYALVVGSEPEIYEWVCLGPDINNDIDGFLVVVVPDGGVLTRLQMESIRDAHLEGRTTVLRLGEETSGVMSMVVTQVIYDDSGSISVFCCFDSGDSAGIVSMYSANAEAETVFSTRELLDSEDMDGIYNSIANPNLLTNPDFSINQRGETIYTGTADEYTYTVDCWRIKGEGSTYNTETKEVSLIDTGVFEQYVEMPVYLRGEFVTATFKVSEYSGEIAVRNTNAYTVITSPITTISFQVPTDVGGIRISFVNISGSTVTFKPVFVKLEVGQHSTPLSSPSIAEELIKCQRLYKKWSTDGTMDIYRGNATSSTSVDLIMPTFSMRTVPTVTYSNLYAPCNGHVDENSPAITGVSSVQSDTDCTVITFDTSDQTAFAGYSLQIRGGGYLALDSEVMADILLDLSTTLTGCTLVISDGVDTYKVGSNVIPKDTQLTITATASEGYTLDGMTFTVNGAAFVNGSTTDPITTNVSIVATASLLALPGDYVLGDYYDIEDSDSPISSWGRAHIDIEDKFYTLNYSFDGGDPTDLVVKGYPEAMGGKDIILNHGAHDPIIFADYPILVETEVSVGIVNGAIDENKILTSSDTVTTLMLYNMVPGEGEASSPNLGKIVSINSLEATVMQDLVITATDCTVKVVDHRDNSIEFLEGTGTLPTSYNVDFIVTPAEGYVVEGMTFEVNGIPLVPSTESLVVPAGTVNIVATAAEVLAQPFTIPGDYALSDRNNESEMFKDSTWEAEHMDILDQWYTLTYSFDGGPSSTALLKGMPGVDMGFGEMDIMTSPTGDMASLADEQVTVIILNAVVTPGGDTTMSITPSESVTTLVLENNVDGEEGAPSPNIGKIVSLTSLVASEMNDLAVTATNCTVSVVSSQYSEELSFTPGVGVLPMGYEVAFQITPAQGYTTDGMTFLVNGTPTDITSSLVISGDVTITATAVVIP